MSKEHVFPVWLIDRCRARHTGIRWGVKSHVAATAATVPLCVECNNTFGAQLEGPALQSFRDLEDGRGISDDQAELLVRWMWKIKGLGWIANHPGGDYSEKYTLRDRVLRPIDEMRPNIVFCVALLQNVHKDSTDRPMGMNAYTEHDAVFVAGVFSLVAMMAVLAPFRDYVPDAYRQHRLAPRRDDHTTLRSIHPDATFADDLLAVGVSYTSGRILSELHDRAALWGMDHNAV